MWSGNQILHREKKKSNLFLKSEGRNLEQAFEAPGGGFAEVVTCGAGNA